MPSRWPSYREKQVIWNKLGYTPYPLQEPVHHSTARVMQLVGAEGGGKSYITAMENVARIPWCRLIYLVGQEYGNVEREFDYMANACLELGITDRNGISKPKNPPWEIRVMDCRITTVSVQKSGATDVIAKGEQPDIINLCEAGVLQSKAVFNAAWRRSWRANGLVFLSGTLHDDGDWYATLEDDLRDKDNDYSGETFSVPAWANLSVYPGGEDDPVIETLRRTLPEDEFARTVAARKMTSLAAIFGGVFDLDIHMRHCPFDPSLPVTLAIDPGFFPGAYAVAVFQKHGDELWQIDEVYEHHLGSQQIIDICKERVWWPAVRELVGDVAMKQHQTTSGTSDQQVWKNQTDLPWTGRKIGVMDGITRHRQLLHQRRMFHDKDRCRRWTRWEYKMYRRRVDKDGVPISDEPVDKDNHLMKCCAYIGVNKFGLADPVLRRRRPVSDPWAKSFGLGAR